MPQLSAQVPFAVPPSHHSEPSLHPCLVIPLERSSVAIHSNTASVYLYIVEARGRTMVVRRAWQIASRSKMAPSVTLILGM